MVVKYCALYPANFFVLSSKTDLGALRPIYSDDSLHLAIPTPCIGDVTLICGKTSYDGPT